MPQVLEKQGYVEREKFSSNFRSELTLSEEPRKTILSLVTLVNKFQKGDAQTIREGRTWQRKHRSLPTKQTKKLD